MLTVLVFISFTFLVIFVVLSRFSLSLLSWHCFCLEIVHFGSFYTADWLQNSKLVKAPILEYELTSNTGLLVSSLLNSMTASSKQDYNAPCMVQPYWFRTEFALQTVMFDLGLDVFITRFLDLETVANYWFPVNELNMYTHRIQIKVNFDVFWNTRFQLTWCNESWEWKEKNNAIHYYQMRQSNKILVT